MKIELLYFPGCPNYQEADALVKDALQRLAIPAEIAVYEVTTQEDAVRLQFLGSPTIRVDGLDIDPSARTNTDFGLKCRVYRSGNRFRGIPPKELLEHAMKEASAAGADIDS